MPSQVINDLLGAGLINHLAVDFYKGGIIRLGLAVFGAFAGTYAGGTYNLRNGFEIIRKLLLQEQQFGTAHDKAGSAGANGYFVLIHQKLLKITYLYLFEVFFFQQ